MKNKHLLMTIAVLLIAIYSTAQVKGTFTDKRDGKVYKTVKIGTQTWMAQNLAYKATGQSASYTPKEKFNYSYKSDGYSGSGQIYYKYKVYNNGSYVDKFELYHSEAHYRKDETYYAWKFDLWGITYKDGVYYSLPTGGYAKKFPSLDAIMNYMAKKYFESNWGYKNSQTATEDEPATGCWAYNDDINNVAKYGYLYTYETAKNVCPAGWHLPSDAEWTTLTDYLGGEDAAGTKMKSTIGWKNNKNGTNTSGFSGLPGGGNAYYKFDKIGSIGYWWSSTRQNDYCSWGRCLGWLNDYSINRQGYTVRVTNISSGTLSALSVRCIKD